MRWQTKHAHKPDLLGMGRNTHPVSSWGAWSRCPGRPRCKRKTHVQDNAPLAQNIPLVPFNCQCASRTRCSKDMCLMTGCTASVLLAPLASSQCLDRRTTTSVLLAPLVQQTARDATLFGDSVSCTTCSQDSTSCTVVFQACHLHLLLKISASAAVPPQVCFLHLLPRHQGVKCHASCGASRCARHGHNGWNFGNSPCEPKPSLRKSKKKRTNAVEKSQSRRSSECNPPCSQIQPYELLIF